NSAQSRLHEISTPQEVLDSVVGEVPGLNGNVDTVYLDFYNGNAVLTVNAKSQVTKTTGGFQIKADAKGLYTSIGKGDFKCDMSRVVEATNFVW
ncbi:MAG: hypothetical protein LBS96_03925, partial [Oscillospiraceae bacterium]|nr:hypothetical protein [Oscillospiraceae bacterium]